MEQIDQTRRLTVLAAPGDRQPDAGSGKPGTRTRIWRTFTRRGALATLGGLVPATACSHALLPGFTLPASLPGLEKQLIQAVRDYERWFEIVLEIDEASFHDPNDRLLDLAKGNEAAAWERQLASAQAIADVTATDIRGLMVQAQVLATRHVIGCLEEHRLVDAFIRGLKRIRPATERCSSSDAKVLSACQNWNAAIDEVEVAEFVWQQILSEWPSRVSISAPALWAVIEADNLPTGYAAASERLTKARDWLGIVEESVGFTTASTFTALLAQASPIARRIAPKDAYSHVSARIGLALVRGLERLGGQRTRDLHSWWGTEADDPPMANI